MKPQNNDFLYLHFILSTKYTLLFYTKIRLVFLIFEIKYCLTKVLEQPGDGTPALNVMAIRDQRHANVSKQRMLLADADVAPHHGLAPVT